jgi:hypothetical protein
MTSCGSVYFFSNAFKISVITCITPTIVAANVASSYQFYVLSSFSQVQVLPSSYISSTGANCTVRYTLYLSTGILYTASSPLSLGLSTGILSIESNIEFT